VNRLRHRLIFVFLAATVPPLVLTLWLANALLERSVRFSTAQELDQLSHTLEDTARRLYRRERDLLRGELAAGAIRPETFSAAHQPLWPSEVREFYEQGERERFLLSGKGGDTLDYLLRSGNDVLRYSRPLGDLRMEEIQREISRARDLATAARDRDLRRVFLLVAVVPWVAALLVLIWSARRISRPIQDLTAALQRIATGDLSVRLPETRHDQTGKAMFAFNRMAEELQQNRERLLYLARLDSWQALARKTAHEIKNSLTPIRLTMEELAVRHAASGDSFEKQAAQIIADEVNSLERRVRAFSEFAAEPPVHVRTLDANAILEERIAFLKTAHPEVSYQVRLDAHPANAIADPDLLKGLLTNLLENAAEAAGTSGRVLAVTTNGGSRVSIEIHDSGPGLPAHVLERLFEPAISFKKGGMGLGLSIARKSALLCGGDIVPVKGELGGAAFRVLLPCPNAAS
jgi:two-component system, NtrC family, nitrogen regulation sensor histidine kinase NtrY